MNSQKALLTALGCAGSLAAMLVTTSPAVAADTAHTDDQLPTLTQAESNPITDALRCGCARCALGDVTPAL